MKDSEKAGSSRAEYFVTTSIFCHNLDFSSTPMHMAVLGVLESAEFALWTFSFANATATQPKES